MRLSHDIFFNKSVISLVYYVVCLVAAAFYTIHLNAHKKKTEQMRICTQNKSARIERFEAKIKEKCSGIITTITAAASREKKRVSPSCTIALLPCKHKNLARKE